VLPGKFDPVQFHYNTARIGWFIEHSSCAAGGIAILYTFTTIRQVLGGSLRASHVLLCCWGDFDPEQCHYHTARIGWFNEHSSCAAGNCNPVHIHYLTTWIGWFIENFSCAAGERFWSCTAAPVQLVLAKKIAYHQPDQSKQWSTAARSSNPCQIQEVDCSTGS